MHNMEDSEQLYHTEYREQVHVEDNGEGEESDREAESLYLAGNDLTPDTPTFAASTYSRKTIKSNNTYVPVAPPSGLFVIQVDCTTGTCPLYTISQSYSSSTTLHVLCSYCIFTELLDRALKEAESVFSQECKGQIASNQHFFVNLPFPLTGTRECNTPLFDVNDERVSDISKLAKVAMQQVCKHVVGLRLACALTITRSWAQWPMQS
jgi:hypothetical protein